MRTKRHKNLAQSLPVEAKEIYHEIFTEYIPKYYSSDNKITDPQIRELLLERGVKKSYTLSIILRAVVNEFRKNEIVPICSNNRGYWVGKNKREIMDTIEGLENRIVGLQAAADGLRKMYNNL
jgi:hypothetical protein